MLLAITAAALRGPSVCKRFSIPPPCSALRTSCYSVNGGRPFLLRLWSSLLDNTPAGRPQHYALRFYSSEGKKGDDFDSSAARETDADVASKEEKRSSAEKKDGGGAADGKDKENSEEKTTKPEGGNGKSNDGGGSSSGKGKLPGLLKRFLMKPKEPKELKESKDLKESKEPKEPKDPKESKESKEPKEQKESKESNIVPATVEEAVEKKTDAIVPTVVRYEKVREVLIVPLTEKPAFPGLYRAPTISDSKLLDKILEDKAVDRRFVGAFLIRDSPRQRSGVPSSWVSEAETRDEDKLQGAALYKQLYEYGTLCKVKNVTRMFNPPQIVLQGHVRLRLTGMVSEDPLVASVEWVKDKPFEPENDVLKATLLEAISTMQSLMMLSPFFREGISQFLQSGGSLYPPQVGDCGIGLSTADGATQQQGLEQLDVLKRVNMALTLLKKDLDVYKLQASIAKAIEEKISGEQRRFLLMEQLKAIKKELGLEADDKTALSAKFRERLDNCRDGCPAHVLQVIEEELTKLQFLEASSSEFNVTRNYLDWLTSIPWGQYSKENFDVRRAQKILDEDHYGLTDIKERIMEFIAVGKLRGSVQGKIICLSGPPGVGKTSIGRSIAKALNRKFYRFSVGGLSDVAEIKGHRRTYVGAMPGKMVQCLKSIGTANPLVLIDEIDKLGRGHAGDPASALLELLDPEQNSNFLDHYLDVPIDLSKVLFVCTANVVETIPGPLLDRMEVIRLVGYISDEKMHIARDYLEPAAREGCGIKPEQATITQSALNVLIETYCREAGVRNLQKHIEKIYRKVALKLVTKDAEVREEMRGVVIPTDMSAEVENKEAIVVKRNSSTQLMLVTAESESESAEVVSEVIIEEDGTQSLVKKVVISEELVSDATKVNGENGLTTEEGLNDSVRNTTDPPIILDSEKLEVGTTIKHLDEMAQHESATKRAEDKGLSKSAVGEVAEEGSPIEGSKRAVEEEKGLAGLDNGSVDSLATSSDDGKTEAEATTVTSQEKIDFKEDERESEKVTREKQAESVDEPTEILEDKVSEETEPSIEETLKDVEKIVVEESNLSEYVGNAVFQSDRIYDQTPIGVVMGLAWTAMGGSTLYVETTQVDQGDGKGSLQLTGQLGDVMKESASIAHTVARKILRERDSSNLFFRNTTLHLHVPAGATPKDGPSAGCTMITSLLSVAMDKPVRRDVAMTGEVTLTGRILAIGGVKEKTIAARRSGVKVLIFPKANKADFDELLPHVKEGFEVHFVEQYMEIFRIAFGEEVELEVPTMEDS